MKFVNVVNFFKFGQNTFIIVGIRLKHILNFMFYIKCGKHFFMYNKWHKKYSVIFYYKQQTFFW